MSQHQIEYLIKSCAEFNKALFSVNDPALTPHVNADVIVDNSGLNVIKKVYTDKRQVKLEPGVTLLDLNNELA